VTLILSLSTEAAAHDPKPADHCMTELGAPDTTPQSVHFQKDCAGADYDNDGHSHIDAMCHIAYEDLMYNGSSAGTVTDGGAEVNSILVLEAGLSGRGVLLDDRLRGVPWPEPGEHVFRADLEGAGRDQRVTVRAGEILGACAGARRARSVNTASAKAGLDPTAMTYIGERSVAALGSDGNNDTDPSSTELVESPVHVLAIAARGIHLPAYLQFEDPRARVRGDRALGVPVRRRATADRRRYRALINPTPIF
jgi:Putative cyclase